MATQVISRRIATVLDLIAPIFRFVTESSWANRGDSSDICDFTFGNPHDAPLPAFVGALQHWSVPQANDWFAYKTNEPAARALIAASLCERRGLPFEADDVFLTNGAFAALSVTLAAITNPGDEVIFISPPWFFYEALIAAYGARPVRVKMDSQTFDLDLNEISAATSERTKAIIVNSPNNPSGNYPPATLAGLAQLLTAASERIGHPIYVLSDEAYSRIVFDQREYHSPTAFYPNSFLLYTYGKTLLTPGERIGYVALPPAMPGREQIRAAIFASQIVTGYAFPNALLQHALPDFDSLSIDIGHLQRKRDRLAGALRAMGYDLHIPEGTFYLLVRSPWADDYAFTELLATHHIFCLPGTVVELPGYFRISLTASDEMIERALPGFAAAIQQASHRVPDQAMFRSQAGVT